jgi:hypothetical protein
MFAVGFLLQVKAKYGATHFLGSKINCLILSLLY